MKFVREPVDGWLIAMNDETGMRAVPESIFRFGRVATGGRPPLVEILQPRFCAGTRHFQPFEDEEAVRTFLTGLGFTEQPRATSASELWRLSRRL